MLWRPCRCPKRLHFLVWREYCAISNGVSPLLLGKFKFTCGFPNRGQNIRRLPASTARCSAVFPSLSTIFIIHDSDHFLQVATITSTFSFSTATWRSVLPLASRRPALPGHLLTNMSTFLKTPTEAATWMGKNPAWSGWYRASGLASNTCRQILDGPNWIINFIAAAKWSGVLPFSSLCVARSLFCGQRCVSFHFNNFARSAKTIILLSN